MTFSETIGEIIHRKPEHKEKKEFTPEGIKLLFNEALENVDREKLSANDLETIKKVVDTLRDKFDFQNLEEETQILVQGEITRLLKRKMIGISQIEKEIVAEGILFKLNFENKE